MSPFASKDRSIQFCIQLKREGRCALATSINPYRFTILFDEVVMFSKLLGYYFAVIPTELVCIMIDLFIMVVFSWAPTRSQPAPQLSKFRRKARLLGAEPFVLSVDVDWLIHTGCPDYHWNSMTTLWLAKSLRLQTTSGLISWLRRGGAYERLFPANSCNCASWTFKVHSATPPAPVRGTLHDRRNNSRQTAAPLPVLLPSPVVLISS